VRFVPHPCAEFPNDNPDLHDGALWVCGWTRARARAVVSAEGVARQGGRAPEFDELPASHQPTATTREVTTYVAEPTVSPLAVPPETGVETEAVMGGERKSEPLVTMEAVIETEARVEHEPSPERIDLAETVVEAVPVAGEAAVASQPTVATEFATPPPPEDAKETTTAAEFEPNEATELEDTVRPTELSVFESEIFSQGPAVLIASVSEFELTWTDLAHLVVPPPEDEIYYAETAILRVPTPAPVAPPEAQRFAAGLTVEDHHALNAAFDRFLGEDAHTPSENLAVLLARTVAPMINRAQVLPFDLRHRASLSPGPEQLDLLNRPSQLSLDLRTRQRPPVVETPSFVTSAPFVETPAANERGSTPQAFATPLARVETLEALTLEPLHDEPLRDEPVAELVLQSAPVVVASAPVVVASAPVVVASVPVVVATTNDFAVVSRDESLPPQTLLGELPRPTQQQEPDDGAAERIADAVSALDELFDDGITWQTPCPPTSQLKTENATEALSSGIQLQPAFRVPRPTAFEPEAAPLVLPMAIVAPEPALEPLTLDLTPPPPGVAGWDKLCDFVSGFLLSRGATRSAALAAALLDGKKVDFERLPESTREALCEASIAQSRPEGVFPSSAFRKEASAFQREFMSGRADSTELMRWLSTVIRALLANAISAAAVRAHLEQAGIERLLKRAA
jgi:hypothetical protein